jgi:hypothetical protein
MSETTPQECTYTHLIATLRRSTQFPQTKKSERFQALVTEYIEALEQHERFEIEIADFQRKFGPVPQCLFDAYSVMRQQRLDHFAVLFINTFTDLACDDVDAFLATLKKERAPHDQAQ